MNQNHRQTRKGFTLLEVLLVIAAIGILAAIVLVAINPNRQISQARNAQRRSDVNTIYKAIEQYLIDTGSYPTGITTTLKDICNTGNKTTTDILSPTTLCDGKADLRVLVPTYIAGIPTDPAGSDYQVGVSWANNKISVASPSSELSQSIVINPIPTTPPDVTPSNTSWWNDVYLSAIDTWSSSNTVTIEGVNTTITLRINLQDPDQIFNGFEVYKNGSIAYSATSSLYDSNVYLDVVSGDIIYFRAKTGYSGTLFYPLFINIYNDSDSGVQLDSLDIYPPGTNNL